MRGKRQGRRKSTIRSSDSLDLVSFEGVPADLITKILRDFVVRMAGRIGGAHRCRNTGRRRSWYSLPCMGPFLSLAWGLAISQEDYDFAAHLESGYGRYGGKKVARTWRRCAGTDHAIGQLCAVRTDR